MIGFVAGSLRMHCDWCFKRSPANPDNPDLTLRPPRWGTAEHDGEVRHACPRHTRKLRAWERGE